MTGPKHISELLPAVLEKIERAHQTGNTITLELPFPPSVNHYWGTRVLGQGRRGFVQRYVSAEGKAFKQATLEECLVQDIRDILKKRRQHAEQQDDNKPYTPCPEHIRQAWMWFCNRMTADSGLLKGLYPNLPEVDDETAERYLLTVNQETKKSNMADWIPDEYKLPEVWG